jgi:diguanylate cyclase (GGDEF)-like protein
MDPVSVTGLVVAVVVAVVLVVRRVDPLHRPTWYRSVDTVHGPTPDRRRAGIDHLTGLLDRVGIVAEIDRRMASEDRENRWVSVIHLDVDDFKDINDAFGHAAGDELLVRFGARLAEAVGTDGRVGRTSSDEFTIVAHGASASSGSRALAARVLASMCEPFVVPSLPSPVTVGASLGIADGRRSTSEALLHDADVALSMAKSTGKARAAVFTRSMQSAIDNRRRLEADLGTALASDQFFLLYQPTFSLDTGRLAGVEALLRWRHPVRGLVMPDTFIPSLEASGLIVAVGRWVLEEACGQAVKWNTSVHRVEMAVNVSGRQLESDGLVGEVEHELAASGLDPGLLTLELTETVLMRNVHRTLTRLQGLQGTGVRLAVDDFGTGYSSIAYLQRFPIDVIKIDQSFVGEMTETRESAALVHALVQMAKALGLETVAEGIESEQQRTMLRGEGVEIGQGFLMARPMEAAAVDRLLASSVV